MELRPARQADLPQINGVYRAVIRHMEQGGLKIWDEIYPCCCFPQDIAEERLYRKNGWKQVAGAGTGEGPPRGFSFDRGREIRYTNR